MTTENKTTELCIVDQIFMMIKIQQNTSKYDQYEKLIKQKTSVQERKLDINLFHSTSFFHNLWFSQSL